MMLQDEEVLGGGGAVHVGHERDRSAGEVHRHRHSALHREIADLLGLQNAA